MSYREKTPNVISILQRQLKSGKTFEDFQLAHTPGTDPKPTTYGYEVDFFGVPTRVINAVSAEDPTVIYSVGLSYGTIEEIFAEAAKGSSEDAAPGKRGERLDEVCEDLAPPVIALVASDNDYGGNGAGFTQQPLAQVTPEISMAVKSMLDQHPKRKS